MSQVYENIIKSPTDNREYRGLILQNEMKVLLVSDPATEKAAASLGINVGYFCDPEELPGLAHFCEHMLFMGTEKYPDISEYSNFISNHGGFCNATTDTQETKFMFNVTPDALKETLERFAQFFIKPLFDKGAIEKEVNAVNSEHTNNISDDEWRAVIIDTFLCNPTHPFHHFGTGNLDTLQENPMAKGINVRDELIKFHEQWYSSNIMVLVVIGQESLDDLQNIVEDLFEKVPNKKVNVPMWTEYPYTSEQLGTITKVLPIQDLRMFKIIFPLPDIKLHYKTAPDLYLFHLCVHESKGSLLSVLKKLGWSTGISCYPYKEFGFGFFVIIINLTEEGLDHTGNIAVIVFQYLNMLKNESPQKYFFDECSAITNLEFKFTSKEDEIIYAYNLNTNLLLYPMEEVLVGPYAMSKFDSNLIQSILETFTPENARIVLFAKEFEKVCDQNDEPYYGILYHTEKISTDKMQELQNAGLHNDLFLPQPNRFIPTDFQMLSLKNITPHPEIIINNPYMRVWFKQDSQFLIPKMNIKLKLLLPFATLDAVYYNLTCLYIDLLKDSLNEELYEAKIAGVNWSFNCSDQSKRGITISFSGFNDKMLTLVSMVLERMKKFKVDLKRFHMILESRKQNIKNFEVSQPCMHTLYHLNTLLSEVYWTNDELLRQCDIVTEQELQNFIPILFSKVYVEALVHGNCDKTVVAEISSIIETHFDLQNVKSINRKQNRRDREHKLEEGKEYVYNSEHKYNLSSCTSNLYQCGLQETKQSVLMQLIQQIIDQPCFNQLRTQEQLGYIVWTINRRSSSTQGLMIIVQSESLPAYIDMRIENFLNDFKVMLEKMTREEFQTYKDALTASILEKPKNLVERTENFWMEIINQQYHFSRDVIDASYLKNVKKEELLSYYNDHIGTSGRLRSKLAIYVMSKLHPDAEVSERRQDVDEIKTYTEITDPVLFKNSTALYGLMKPYISIPMDDFEDNAICSGTA